MTKAKVQKGCKIETSRVRRNFLTDFVDRICGPCTQPSVKQRDPRCPHPSWADAGKAHMTHFGKAEELLFFVVAPTAARAQIRLRHKKVL